MSKVLSPTGFAQIINAFDAELGSDIQADGAVTYAFAKAIIESMFTGTLGYTLDVSEFAHDEE
jgi:hypothetical protein